MTIREYINRLQALLPEYIVKRFKKTLTIQVFTKDEKAVAEFEIARGFTQTQTAERSLPYTARKTRRILEQYVAAKTSP